jgi:hypothetical protein
LKLKQDRLTTEQLLAVKERELGVAKSTFPLDVKKIVDLKQSVKGLKSGIEAIDDLAVELGLRDQDLKDASANVSELKGVNLDRSTP